MSHPDTRPWRVVSDLAVIHTIGAFALVIFLIAHVYMTTTASTTTSNITAMITGYEDIEEQPQHDPATV